MLSYFHTESPLETDFRALVDNARETKAETVLYWHEQQRYSKRQGTTMKMGGVVGHIRVSDPRLAQSWPYLWLGQFIHAGSGATMGLGAYRIKEIEKRS